MSDPILEQLPEHIREQIRELTSHLVKRWSDALHPKPPGLLYHYTDFDGFHGIIKTNTLRATYSKALNDGSERQHGEGIASHALKQFCSEPLHSVIDGAIKQMNHSTFVASFCESDELLSMWRAYARDGNGYCLGFDPSELAHMVLDSPDDDKARKPKLVKIYYCQDDKELPGSLLSCIKEVGEAYNIHVEIASAFLELVMFFGDMIKHKSFDEEKEWRLVAFDPDVKRMHFRDGHTNIKPYVELSKWYNKRCPLPIKHITCGPRLRDGDRPDDIVKWMLKKYDYNDVEVTSCLIPYRLS